MRLTTLLLCVFLVAAASRATAQIPKSKQTHLPSSENNPNKPPPGIEIIRCPEWLTVNFDKTKTPAGWISYGSYTTRATEAVVVKGKAGKQLLQCVYGAAVLEREVPANKCKVYVESDGRWKSFQCFN
jgi:hypothetical protein